MDLVQSFQTWYRGVPPVTRAYLTLSFITSVACFLEIINEFDIYFNWALIKRGQVWRLLTNYFFFGKLGIEFGFHMFFMSRYSRMLEEGSFRNQTADFLFMLLFGAVSLTTIAPFIDIQFLGSSLSFMMVYLWSRRNKYVNMNFMGLFNFTAPYLPWVLLVFSVMLGHSPKVDLLGLLVGHVYYYLMDVYPRVFPNRPKPLQTPELFKWAVNQAVNPAPTTIRVQQAPTARVVRAEAAGTEGGGASAAAHGEERPNLGRFSGRVTENAPSSERVLEDAGGAGASASGRELRYRGGGGIGEAGPSMREERREEGPAGSGGPGGNANAEKEE